MTERSAGAENSTKREALRTASQLSRLYLDAIRAADAAGAFRVASSALAQGMTTAELYQRVITPAMYEVGVLWEKGVLTVADEHLATALTHRVLASRRPPLRVEIKAGEKAAGRVMLAAVGGEQHALGLRMVADVLEDAGFHTIYLGGDVPVDALLQSMASLSPDLLALSVTMPDLTSRLEEMIGAIRQAYPDVGLLLGGQGVPPDFEVGATVQDLEVLPKWLASADVAN